LLKSGRFVRINSKPPGYATISIVWYLIKKHSPKNLIIIGAHPNNVILAIKKE